MTGKNLEVLQAIFASETIQDIIPLASNAILILGQVEGIQGSKVYVTKLVAFDFLIPMVLFVIISHVMSCGCLQGDRALAVVYLLSALLPFVVLAKNFRLSGGVLNQRAPKGSQRYFPSRSFASCGMHVCEECD
ncbi:hypothetical protein ACSBR1_041848 [Camellia fascicularis]